jgi:uncharacterized membrane protein (DUF2068 family)
VNEIPRRRTLRAIAAFEAIKGLIALAAGAGLLGFLHHDLHHIAEALISHIGLKPGDHYPAIFLRYVDVVRDANLRLFFLAAAGYVAVRWLEAYGLWNERAWGQWLGALSGALYVPFEVWHLVHRPTAASSIVLASNIAVVGFLGWQLWRQRSS